ncbi:MAG: hypothetical protein K2X78_04235 [Burkholderiaceae bacterium]|nr:hypothetical protein [Burkholderiaceae bacterium]
MHDAGQLKDAQIPTTVPHTQKTGICFNKQARLIVSIGTSLVVVAIPKSLKLKMIARPMPMAALREHLAKQGEATITPSPLPT